MIEKLRKKFIIFSLLSVFALLVVILSAINVTNFSLVAKDADNITQMLINEGGKFNDKTPPQNEGKAPIGTPVAPDSPETKASMRYFAYSFDKGGNATKLAYNVNAITEDEAQNIAKSLTGAQNTTGWTNGRYRYRVDSKDGNTTVVVIDESRELRPSYQVLYISVFGSLAGLIITLLVLIPVSKKLIKPFETSDNKQKRFIADAARELKVPISVMYANNEVSTQDEELTKSNVKQLKKMQKLVDDLDDLLVFDKKQDIEREPLDIAKLTDDVIKPYEDSFKNKNVELLKEYGSPIPFNANANMLKRMYVEIIENGLKYSKTFFKVKLSQTDTRLTIETFNDGDNISDGELDRVFERFYRMQNGVNSTVDGNGVGLSIVKEIVALNSGRCTAKGESGTFHLKIEL